MDRTELAIFELLERSTEEPLLRESTNEAIEQNRLFEDDFDEVVEMDKMQNIVQKLDEKVAPLRNMVATVTGYVYYADPDRGTQRDGDPIISRQWVNAAPIVFNGFAIDPNLSADVYDDDEQDIPAFPLPGRMLRVVYHGRAALSALRDVPRGSYDDEALRGCSFDLDSIIIFDEMSFDRAAAFLKMSYPEIIHEIDSRIFKAKNETEAVLSLREFAIDVSKIEDEDGYELISALNAYLSSAISFDKQVPYVAEVNGNVIEQDENNDFVKQVIDLGPESKLLCYIDSLQLINDAPRSEGRNLAIYAKLRVMTEDIDSPPMELYVHIDAIKRLVSVRRDLIYGPDENEVVTTEDIEDIAIEYHI